jgi:hypothetical protein
MWSNHLCPLNCLFGDSCFSLNKLSPPPRQCSGRGVRLDDIIMWGTTRLSGESTDLSLLMRQGFGNNSGRFSQPSFSQTNANIWCTPLLFTKPTKCQHEQSQCSSIQPSGKTRHCQKDGRVKVGWMRFSLHYLMQLHPTLGKATHFYKSCLKRKSAAFLNLMTKSSTPSSRTENDYTLRLSSWLYSEAFWMYLSFSPGNKNTIFVPTRCPCRRQLSFAFAL